MTYLNVHLRKGVVVPLKMEEGNSNRKGVVPPNNGVSVGGSTNLMTPVPLGRSKSSRVANNKTGVDDGSVISTEKASVSSSKRQQQKHMSLSPSYSTTSSCNIDKLQEKVINRRLEQEHTPMEQFKDNMSSWLSSIVDCASFGCCQDTTTSDLPNSVNGIQTTPVRSSKQQQQYQLRRQSSKQRSMTPRSTALKGQGIGGLSFEVETVTSTSTTE